MDREFEILRDVNYSNCYMTLASLFICWLFVNSWTQRQTRSWPLSKVQKPWNTAMNLPGLPLCTKVTDYCFNRTSHNAHVDAKSTITTFLGLEWLLWLTTCEMCRLTLSLWNSQFEIIGVKINVAACMQRR